MIATEMQHYSNSQKLGHCYTNAMVGNTKNVKFSNLVAECAFECVARPKVMSLYQYENFNIESQANLNH